MWNNTENAVIPSGLYLVPSRLTLRQEPSSKIKSSATLFELSEAEKGADMQRLFMGIFAAALLCGISLAQSPAPPANGSPSQTPPASIQGTPQNGSATAAPSTGTPSTGTPKIAPGSVIPVQLTKTVDAKKAKVGDEIDAKVTQDMKSTAGELLVPKDTKVIGRVTEAQARTKEQKESQLAIAFDRAVTKTGEDMNLPMSIQAIVAPPTMNPDNSANGGGAPAEPTSAGAGGAMAPGGTGSRPATTAGAQPQAPPAPNETASNDSGANRGRPPINAQTKGVIGLSGVQLSTARNGTQGSVVTSEKSNVKLESGTMMLLRVNQ